MAFYENNIGRTDGGIVHISSTDTGWKKPIGEDEQSIYDWYSIGVVEPSNTITLNTNIPIIDPSDVVNLFPSGFNDSRTEEYFASDTYLLLKQRLIDGNLIQWLWGSYEAGGACYYAIDSNTIQFRTISGFYHTGQIEGHEVYGYNTFSVNFSIDEAKELKFSVEEGKVDQINANFFPLKIYIGGNTFNGSVYKYDVRPSLTYFDAGYYPDEVNSGNFGSVLGKCGVYANFPESVPFVEDIPKYIFIANKVLYCWDHNFPGGELISGSFYGNAEIDEEGNPFLPGEYSFPAGGWGEFPNRSDEIDTTNPENFGVDVVSSGFLTLYNPSTTEIINFNRFLFSDLTDGMINQLRKLTTEPLQYLIFMAMCHFEPVSNSREEISFAGIGSGVTANKISKQYKQINCGKVFIPEASKSFLDYGGFSKVSIFLPYCGIQQLNIDDVMGAEIKVVYNIDQLTGACLVQVKCTRNARNASDTSINSVLYTFNGNCYETIPIFASDWRSAINAITGLVSGIASAAVTKDVSGLLSTVTDAVTSEKVKVNRSGSPSVSFGYMDNQRPYLILERPVQNIPTDYGKFNGYTTNMKYSLISLRGYTEIDVNGIIATDFNCLDEELSEIKQLLETGVYL